MPKNFFGFKQFTIYQPYDDVMKVSTDSVLLGCFANCQNKNNALDIGCGTGLLCLMMAQKNPKLQIIGIDINPNAYVCSEYNVKHSPFQSKIKILQISLKEFVEQSKLKFELVISNPPYFSKSLKSISIYKNVYRHQETLTYEELLQSVNTILTDNGSFYVIIPYYEQKSFLHILNENNMHIHQMLNVYSNSSKEHPYTSIYEIKKTKPKDTYLKTLFIYDTQNKYSAEYIDYTKDFYLHIK